MSQLEIRARLEIVTVSIQRSEFKPVFSENP